MKIRNGFVSNSSSSSFIVGIAKIIDYNKLTKYIRKNKITLDYDLKVVTLSKILENRISDVRVYGDNIIVDSFQTDARISVNGYIGEELFLVVNKCYNEGDNSFTHGDDCDIDYDIDLSWFETDDQRLYEAFFSKTSGLDLNNQVSYGAGRNG